MLGNLHFGLDNRKFEADIDIRAAEMELKRREADIKEMAVREETKRSVMLNLLSQGKTPGEIKEYLDMLF
jgi:hypothetical protein